MNATTARRRKSLEIPVLWVEGCRGLPMYIDTMNGIRQMARRKGCTLAVYDTKAALAAAVKPGSVVLFIGYEASFVSRDLQELEDLGMRVVVTNIDSDHIDSYYSCATFSRRVATDQMLDFLYAKGCQRFAMLGCGNLSSNDMVHADAMRKYELRHSGSVNCESFFYHQTIDQSFAPFLLRRDAFDAVLLPNDYAAVAFLRRCEQSGVDVPRQLMVATLKGNLIGRFCCPSITSYSVDFYSVGENSVQVWLYLQELSDERLCLRITVPGRIDERESTCTKPMTGAPRAAHCNLGNSYQGGPFYSEPTLQTLMRLERCLQASDQLDLQIIEKLLRGMSYEAISEAVFLSDSALQYRIRKLFQTAQLSTRGAFERLFQEHFTQNNHFDINPFPKS